VSHRDQRVRSLLACATAASAVALTMTCSARPARAEVKLVDSEISVSGTTAIVSSGDDDQFRQRHGLPPYFTGGVENLRMEWSWGDGGSATLDGRSLFDAGDYLARLKIEKANTGYIKTGYRQYRTWYDGTGGYFRPTDTIFHLYDEDQHLDRGEGWFEIGLRMPNIPEVTLRYSHLSRDGQKNSVEWGDTQLTGGSGTRSIVPAFRNIDEKRNILNLDVTHHMIGSSVGAGFVYEASDINDSLNVRRRPTEPQDRFFTQTDRTDSDIWGAHAFTSTPFVDNRVVCSTSYGYARLESDLGGSRIYGNQYKAPFNPTYTNRQPLDEGFINLDGTTKLDQHVGTLTLQTRLADHLLATAGGRVEQYDIDGNSTDTGTDVGFPPTFDVTQQPYASKSNANMTAYTGSLDVQYKGWQNWVWTAFGEWEQREGDLNEKQLNTTTPAVTLERDTDITRWGQKYGIGSVWYPFKRVNLSSRYTYRIHDYDYDHKIDSTDNASANRYPAYITSQKIRAHDVDFRLTYRVLDNVRLTARYDGTFSKFQQQVDLLSNINSGNVDTNAFGTSAAWNPTVGSYIQADANYVLSKTSTPADELTGAADGLVVNDFENTYWTATLTSGVALTEAVDLRGQYFFYRAHNYENISLTGQPYGADATEHGVSLQLGYRISENLRWRAGYAFFTNNDGYTGGANDYNASVVTGGVDMKF